MTTNNIIAVEDGHKLAGAIVYWRLSSDIDATRMLNELAKRGIDEGDAPVLPTPVAALARAVRRISVGGAETSFVRKHRGTWYVTFQTDADGEPVFDAAWGVRLDVVGRLEFKGAPSELEQETAKVEYTRALMTLDRNDVSSWLLKRVEMCDAVSLRETGGIYFVPAAKLDDFKRYTEALHEASACRVRFIPAMHTDDAIDAIIESLETEAAAMVTDIERDVASGELGAYALNNRAARAEALGQKLARYEQSLGLNLDKLRSDLENLRGAAVSAALVASEDSDSDA